MTISSLHLLDRDDITLSISGYLNEVYYAGYQYTQTCFMDQPAILRDYLTPAWSVENPMDNIQIQQSKLIFLNSTKTGSYTAECTIDQNGLHISKSAQFNFVGKSHV